MPHYRQRGRLRGNASSGMSQAAGGCGFPPPTNPNADPNCPQIGSRYCFTHLGNTVALAIGGAAGATAPVVLTPANLIEFVPRASSVSVFSGAAGNAQVRFGTVDSVFIYGDNQFAGGTIAWSAFDPQMPFLEVNWRPATPQNPITITLTNLSLVAVTALVVVAGDGLKG